MPRWLWVSLTSYVFLLFTYFTPFFLSSKSFPYTSSRASHFHGSLPIQAQLLQTWADRFSAFKSLPPIIRSIRESPR